jgi:hypothetical protein
VELAKQVERRADNHSQRRVCSGRGLAKGDSVVEVRLCGRAVPHKALQRILRSDFVATLYQILGFEERVDDIV